MKILNSLRVKLTVMYSVIVAGTLFFFAIIAFYYTQEKLFASLDYSLRNEVSWLKTYIEPKARRVKAKRPRVKPVVPKKQNEKSVRRSKEVDVVEEDSIAFDQIWNQIYEHTLLSPKKQMIQIRDRNGDILYKSYSIGKEELVFEDIPVNTTKLATIYDKKGQALRLAVAQTQFSKIYVAYPEAEISEVLGNLFSILLLLVPVAVVLSVLGGWFLSSKSLKPVDSVTRAARAITAQNLDQRITHTGVNDELGRLISTFNEMIERLQSSFEQIQQFSIDASHELRTPLTIIRGEIELALRTKQTTDEYRRALSSLLDEVLRMSSIIENLLMLAKGDLGNAAFRFEEISLTALLKELHEDSEMLAEQKKINVDLDAGTEIKISADTVRLRQLFLNLIDNAIKYTPEHGHILISLAQQNSVARISVKDTGIGISAEEQLKIFNRFYRTDKGRSREMGGAGLGLAIAKWIAEAHGGSISVMSEINLGSTFTVTLPIAKTGTIKTA
jgi:heavy metal sensor kinase